MIERKIENQIKEKLFKGKAILIYGARQTGKTTLVNNIIKSYQGKVLSITGDDPQTRALFNNISIESLKRIIDKNEMIFIDEAQRFLDIGIVIKLIVDNLKGVQVIASGSSAFELVNRTAEPLTGRKIEFYLYPMSFFELSKHYGELYERGKLEDRLIFGSYPEIVTAEGDVIELLTSLSGSYLYRDLLTLESIKKPIILDKLLRALALQIGNEVSFNELAHHINADKETVEKYIDLLEKSYIIFKLPAYSKNVRNEIKRGRKIYFYDNGIRNAIIGDYKEIINRSDKGALWENFIISERVKFLRYNRFYGTFYFWRTTQQQEIDFVEEINGELYAYEFKWNPNKKTKLPLTFKKAYPEHSFKIVSRDNYPEFLI